MKLSDLTKNVFLVDDDEDDCLLTSSMLKELIPTCTVTCLYTGKDLFQKLEQLEPGEYPGFILLDLNMPGMSGFEVLQALKQHQEWSQLPVIILTTSRNKEDMLRAEELGASLFLSKPAGYKETVKNMLLLKEHMLN